jgi:predicted enzyme related to lactoylglutathione lyase
MELRIVRHTDHFDAASHFWGEVLAWPITKEWPAGDGQGRGRIFGYGDVGRVELIEHDSPAAVIGVLLSVEVDDVAALHERLVAAGVQVLRGLADQPWGHRNLAVVDPSGLEVVCYQVIAAE